MKQRARIALGVVLAVAGMLAGAAQAAAPASVTIEIKGATKPKFVIPDGGVAAGADLTVSDETGGSFAGHTFSLVKKSALPTTASAVKSCKKSGHICDAIKKWGEHSEVGENGWDKAGDTGHKGDSSFLNQTSDTRTVRAAAGKTLYFMCEVHPKTMQGNIKVD